VLNAKEALEQIRKTSRWGQADPHDYTTVEGWAGAFADEFITTQKKPHQLRKIFAHVKRIDTVDLRSIGSQLDPNADLPPEARRKLMMLLPQAAYDVGRNLLPKSVYELLKTTLAKDNGKLKSVGDCDRFVDFLSSIVAYQKYRSETGESK